MRIKLFLAYLMATLCGCSSSAQDKLLDQEVLAVIAKPSRQVNEEIQAAVASLLGQKELVIAANAFTKDSSISVERLAHQTVNGQLINGRVTEQPLLINLVKKGKQCFVKNALTGGKIELKHAKCLKLIE